MEEEHSCMCITPKHIAALLEYAGWVVDSSSLIMLGNGWSQASGSDTKQQHFIRASSGKNAYGIALCVSTRTQLCAWQTWKCRIIPSLEEVIRTYQRIYVSKEEIASQILQKGWQIVSIT